MKYLWAYKKKGGNIDVKIGTSATNNCGVDKNASWRIGTR